MGHTLKRKHKPGETMASMKLPKVKVTGEECDDCSTTFNVIQYCSDCGKALCESCYSDEGHEAHDE
jgi:hypothetical protein